MFVWKTSSILKNIERFLPDMYKGLEKICKTYGTENFALELERGFPLLKSESIDFGVMEKADNIYTIPGSFGWDDVGSWLAIERVNKTNEYGNFVKGDVVSIDTKNSTIVGNNKMIAAVGLENIVIVDTNDALLVCAKGSTQDIKRVTEHLKICNRSELL